jgi:Fe-S cluster biogenesis protein NfuA
MEPTKGGEMGDAQEFRSRVTAALDQVRPALQADGGDIELVEIVGVDARVRLKGACHG